MINTYQKNLLHDFAVPNKLDRFFTFGETIAKDNKVIAQGNKASKILNSATLGSASLNPRLTLVFKPVFILAIIYTKANI